MPARMSVASSPNRPRKCTPIGRPSPFHHSGVMDAANRNTFDEHLVADFLPLVPGLTRRLREGGRSPTQAAAPVTPWSLLAREFPASTFTGYDLAADAIERARKEAARDAGLTNVRFEQQDVTAPGPGEPFDAVVSFDTVHNLPDPGGFLSAVHQSLAPGGRFLMIEPQDVQQPGGQHRPSDGAAALRGEHTALPDRLAGRGGLGSAPRSASRRRSNCSPRPASPASRSRRPPAIPWAACSSPPGRRYEEERTCCCSTNSADQPPPMSGFAPADEVFALITDTGQAGRVEHADPPRARTGPAPLGPAPSG